MRDKVITIIVDLGCSEVNDLSRLLGNVQDTEKVVWNESISAHIHQSPVLSGHAAGSVGWASGVGDTVVFQLGVNLNFGSYFQEWEKIFCRTKSTTSTAVQKLSFQLGGSSVILFFPFSLESRT